MEYEVLIVISYVHVNDFWACSDSIPTFQLPILLNTVNAATTSVTTTCVTALSTCIIYSLSCNLLKIVDMLFIKGIFQIVWKGSNRVGCAVTKPYQNRQGKIFACCHYKPAGNIIGHYKEHVLRPKNGRKYVDAI